MPESLYPLLLLACPIGMGLMMWIMMRSQTQQPRDNAQDAATRAELDQLRTQVQRLQSQDTETSPAGTRQPNS